MGIIFNGISSDDIGIHVEVPPDYEIPQRNYEIISVPGRNGDVVIDLGSYNNVDREYQISIGEECGDFTVLASSIASWLYSGGGYLRLEDSYEPEYYKMATVVDPNTVINILGQAGRATIKFNRKPQRFLKTGDDPVYINKNTKIFNPTHFKSNPLIKVRGSEPGIITIGNYTIELNSIESEITIDCELEEAYNGDANLNNTITLSNGYPKLNPGYNDISFSGGITGVVVIPRWWTI